MYEAKHMCTLGAIKVATKISDAAESDSADNG